MARSYRPVIRDQEFLLPPNMADWLPEGHLVWFVLDVVDQLDTSRFHHDRKLGRQGRQGFDPDMLLALMVYAYAVGERSSRQIERRCAEDVAFRVLCGQDAPDHTTIARFRAAHQDGFIDLFAQVLRLCREAGMVKVGAVSIDGTKIAANASRSANRSPDWVREQAQKIAGEVVAEAVATDATEDAGADNDDMMPPGFTTRTERSANIAKAVELLKQRDAENAADDAADRARAEQFLARLEAGEVVKGQVPAGVDPVRWHQARITHQQQRIAASYTMPADRARVIRSSSRRVLRNAERDLAAAQDQAAREGHDLRCASERHRDRRAANARARGGMADPINITDPDSRLMTQGSGGGSVQGYNAQVAVSDDHLIIGVHVSDEANDYNCFAPTLAAATAQVEQFGDAIELVLADAGYFTEENLTSPGPDRLIAPGKNREITTKPGPGPGLNDPDLPAPVGPLDAMRQRLQNLEEIERYKRRSATVEPVIGHLKDKTRLRRFARRGIQAATAELNLAAAALNLTRLHTTTPATG